MDPKMILIFFAGMIVAAAGDHCVPHFCLCKRYEVHCEMPEDANSGEFTYYGYAADQCDQRGGYLANLDNPEIDTLVKNFISKEGLGGPPCINKPSFGFFIGLTDSGTEGTYVWNNGNVICEDDFTNWAPGEPNNNTNLNPEEGQDCVQLWYRFGHDGLWDDEYCNQRVKGYICEIPTHCCCSEGY
ncbi:perlucin-like protein [Ptychodera flava]|uniref:perlucin-like protein n=1 Tax=Ptychodera flava TaxID=63121 RepID=UPI003969E53B